MVLPTYLPYFFYVPFLVNSTCKVPFKKFLPCPFSVLDKTLVMVSVLASSAVDCMFEPRSGQAKDYKIGICCFSAKLTAVRRKSKDQSSRNQDKVSEWGDMFIHELLFKDMTDIIVKIICHAFSARVHFRFKYSDLSKFSNLE